MRMSRRGRGMRFRSEFSDDANLLSFVSLAALTDFELDALTLFEGTVTRALNVREVNEHVVAVLP